MLDGGDAGVLREQVLAMLDDGDFDTMETRDFDDFVHHVFRAEFVRRCCREGEKRQSTGGTVFGDVISVGRAYASR